MKLTFMRLDESLRWFLDIPSLGYGVSYPVFRRGSLRFLLSLIFSRLFRQEFDRHFDPTKPLHDILDS